MNTDEKEIYFDNSATTPLCERALARYAAVSTACYGNPSSRHARGGEAAAILKQARDSIARLLGDRRGTVVFTGSGTEANNLALLGRAYAKARYRGGKILTSAGEHSSVREPLARLAAEGFRVVEIPTRGGVLDEQTLLREVTPDVLLASVMLTNNETGACYDLSLLSRLLRERCRDACLHADATQAFGKLPLSVKALGVRMLTVSAHKIEGPKGVGALYLDPTLLTEHGVAPQILGGGQEGGFRSGTENVPGIAAFAEAALYGEENFEAFTQATDAGRRGLLARLADDSRLSEVRALTPPHPAPHILSLILPRIKSEVMLRHLSARGIYVSSGSACSSHDRKLSSALLAYGCTEEEADCAIRVSLCHRNTEEELDRFCEALAEGIATLSRTRR